MSEKSLAVMTSGGDSQGMNPALRAVVRAGIARGFDVYAIYEGYNGLVSGDIRKMQWSSVSGILDLGGTIIGTARSKEFRERAGRVKAAKNLVERGIDNLVVIGGDGSLTGANEFRLEWPDLLKELIENKEIAADSLKKYPVLQIVGMIGSIDNDMVESDMTIGADSALHRITEAIDALRSTAASHQRTFIVEVMGRNCGYLALMSAIATGAVLAFIPENPPPENWEENICKLLKAGIKAGRRDNIIVVAEGAIDRKGNKITSQYIKEVVDKGMEHDSRITILGHVQRGGSPSAFDRYMSTLWGYEAVNTLLKSDSSNESQLMVMRNNRTRAVPLVEAVEKTRAAAAAIQELDFDKAAAIRGNSWLTSMNIFKNLSTVMPPETELEKPLRIAIMNCGWPAPGMNTANRAIARIAMNMGHKVFGIEDGFEGLIHDNLRELSWHEVEGWTSLGGSVLGSTRRFPKNDDFYHIAINLEKHGFDGLIMVGGGYGYAGLYEMHEMHKTFPAFNIPCVCVPASINNNLPSSEISIGSDTALNTIVEAVDKIKYSADSIRRAYVIEVMGRYCGYLAMMSGLATGAEEIYIHEEGITLDKLRKDLAALVCSFRDGERKRALYIRNENAHRTYSTEFISSLFDAESGDLYDVKYTVLGPLQQGGEPSPFDRIQATKMGHDALKLLIEKIDSGKRGYYSIGLSGGRNEIHNIHDLPGEYDIKYSRAKNQWWLELAKVIDLLAHKPQCSCKSQPEDNKS